jgi:ribosomal protein L32
MRRDTQHQGWCGSELRRASYVKCKNCGFTVQLPYECRFEYPLHFAVKCPRCEHSNVYHRVEVIQEDDEYCRRELEKAEERTRLLEDAVTQSLLLSVVYSTMQTLTETLSSLKQKLEEHRSSTS